MKIGILPLWLILWLIRQRYRLDIAHTTAGTVVRYVVVFIFPLLWLLGLVSATELQVSGLLSVAALVWPNSVWHFFRLKALPESAVNNIEEQS